MMRSMPGTARNIELIDGRAAMDSELPGIMAAHVANGRQRHDRITQPVRRHN